MVSRILARLSYANVVATVALFVALGGTSYAAATIGSGDIKNNSIRSKDIRNGTILRKDITQGLLAPKLYGNFNGDDGTLARGRGVLSTQKGGGSGFYIVRFNRNITNCVLLASVASIDSVNPADTNIGAAYYTGTPGENREAFVLIANDAGTREDADFSLAAFC
jgi:hypothetical protein